MSEPHHGVGEVVQETRRVLDIGHLETSSAQADAVTGEVAGEVTGEVAGEVTDRTGPVADPVTDRADPVTDPVPRLTAPVDRVLVALRGGPLAPSDRQAAPGLTHRPTFGANNRYPALNAGLIGATLPNKPNSRPKKHRLTPAGAAHLTARRKDSDS